MPDPLPIALDVGRIISLAHFAKPPNFGASVSPDYNHLIRSLFDLLRSRNIPVVVVGGIALLQHVRGRNTEDIDLIIPLSRLDELPELVIHEQSDLFAFGQFGALRVDVLFAEHPLFNSIVQSFSSPMSYGAGELPTATIEGLILLKLFALPGLYRQHDFDRVAIYEADLLQLLKRSHEGDEFFLTSLSKHVSSSDLEELGNILSDIRARLAKIGKHG